MFRNVEQHFVRLLATTVAPSLLLLLLPPANANRNSLALQTQELQSPAEASRVLDDVKANQKAIDDILESYTYTKLEEETDLDNQGRVKNKHVRKYEVFYVNGREVQKLVARDDRNLPPLERQKEEERVRKQALKYSAEGTKRAATSRAEEGDEDELHISTFLRAARFTHPRKESFRGQDVIAFDLAPNPEYRAQNLNERLVQRLEGVMLVDGRAHQVVRLQARLANSAKFGGGLLGSVEKGSAAVFEQELVNNEVWLPSYLEEHLSGRFFIFKTYRENLVIRYYEYKKFRVETQTEGTPAIKEN